VTHRGPFQPRPWCDYRFCDSDLDLQPLCDSVSQGTGSQQPSQEGARRRDAAPSVPMAMEMLPRNVPGRCVLGSGVVFMRFMCTVLYAQLFIIPSLVVLGQIYLFSVLFNTQVTTAGALNEFFKNKSTVSHTFSHASSLISCT